MLDERMVKSQQIPISSGANTKRSWTLKSSRWWVLAGCTVLIFAAVVYAKIDAARGLDNLVCGELVSSATNASQLLVIVCASSSWTREIVATER